MKYAIPILILLAVVFSCNSDIIRVSDISSANLHGKVWKVDRRFHDANAGCVCPAATNNECDQSLTVYDENGNITEVFEIDPNGDTASHSVYLYDQKGICKEVDRYSKQKLSEKQKPKFRNGQLVRLALFDEDAKLKSTWNYEYSGGNITKTVVTDADGGLLNRTINEYEQGNLVSQITSGKDGNVTSTVKYKRNENHDVIESLYTLRGDTTLHKATFEYQYDENGNWVKQIKHYQNKIASVVIRNIEYYESSAITAEN